MLTGSRSATPDWTAAGDGHGWGTGRWRTTCGHQNQRAFDKLRQLLMMHYSVRDKAVVAMGEEETMLIIGDIVERLRQRFGDDLGTPRPG